MQDQSSLRTECTKPRANGFDLAGALKRARSALSTFSGHTSLRASYAMSGTNLAYGVLYHARLCALCAVRYQPIVWCYALSGTDLAYGATSTAALLEGRQERGGIPLSCYASARACP
eukprot:918217-Rhodomonas_salina.3